MEAGRARRLRVARELELVEEPVDGLRDAHHVGERRAFRVEVEDEPVGALERRDPRGPGMDRDRAQVGHVSKRLGVVDDEVVDVPVGVPRVDRSVRTQSGANSGASFWKKDLPAMPSG